MTAISWTIMLTVWAIIIAVNLFCLYQIIRKSRRNGS